MEVTDPEKVIWLSQTTLSVDETLDTVGLLRKRFPLMVAPPSDDICYATQNRQEVVKQIAPECDLVIVVGSRNSSNSVRLVEVALDAGARAAIWSTTRARSTSAGSTACHGRRDQRRVRAGRPGRGRARRTCRSGATRPPRSSSRPPRPSPSRCRRSCAGKQHAAAG